MKQGEWAYVANTTSDYWGMIGVIQAPLKKSVPQQVEVIITNGDSVIFESQELKILVKQGFKTGEEVLVNDCASEYDQTLQVIQKIDYDTDIEEWVYQILDEHHVSESLLKSHRNKKTISNKETTMSKTKDQLNANKDSAILAAKLVAGRTINKKLVKLLKPRLPIFARGYADSPFASLVVSNAVGVALKHYAPDNKKAMQIADLMLDAAALEAIESFNIETLLDDLLKGVKLPKELENED